MAKEKYTVFFNIRARNRGPLSNWKEKTIKVKSGEKNNGLVNSDTEPSTHLQPSVMLNNSVLECQFTTIEAESRTEAAEALRAFYGHAVVPNVCLSVLSSNLEEAKMQV